MEIVGFRKKQHSKNIDDVVQIIKSDDTIKFCILFENFINFIFLFFK